MTRPELAASLFAARFGPSPSTVAAVHKQRAEALRAQVEALPAGSEARAAAEAHLRDDPSARGISGLLLREDLDRARKTFGDS